jgi:hypothetical protein
LHQAQCTLFYFWAETGRLKRIYSKENVAKRQRRRGRFRVVKIGAKTTCLSAHGLSMRQSGVIIGKWKWLGCSGLWIVWVDNDAIVGTGSFYFAQDGLRGHGNKILCRSRSGRVPVAIPPASRYSHSVNHAYGIYGEIISLSDSSQKCVVCSLPAEYVCLYCGPPTRFYCPDHRCAHFAEQIAWEAKVERERIRITTSSPQLRGFPNQEYPWNRNIWKDPKEKKFPEALRWFMFAIVTGLILLAIYGAMNGN